MTITFNSVSDATTTLHTTAASRHDVRADPEHTLVFAAYIQLENFREFNDLWGHDVGDRAVDIVITRLRKIGPATDSVSIARLGRDEYMVIAETAGAMSLNQFGHQIIAALREPFIVEHRVHQLSVNVGLTQNRLGSDPESLLLEARLSLQPQRRGIANVGQIYDRTSGARAELIRALPNALQNGEIRCAFQPTIDIRSGEIVHLEALARWTRSNDETVQPNDFVPCAESFGLAKDLTKAVLRSVSELVSAPTTPPRLRVWINTTATELDAADFPAQLLHMLDNAELPYNRVGVEITESQAVRDPLRLATDIAELQQHGVAVAIDDFGSGYSPLGYLRTLAPDIVKLDRSVITDIDTDSVNQRLVIGVIALLRELGIEVIAEGVERIEEEQWLRNNGVYHVQGYLRGVPQDPATLGVLLPADDHVPLPLSEGCAA